MKVVIDGFGVIEIDDQNGAQFNADETLQNVKRQLDDKFQEVRSLVGGVWDEIGSYWDELPSEDKAALSTSAIPVVGDAAGLYADAAMYIRDPDARNWLNYTLTGLSIVPGIPAASQTRKAIEGGLGKWKQTAIDPRYAQGIGTSAGNPRAREMPKIEDMQRTVTGSQFDAPEVSLVDFEGRPFMTHISDRTDAGVVLEGYGGVNFESPVSLQGGQDFMFNTPGAVWASGKGPATSYMRMADALKKETGQNPLWMPFRMAPTGSDFSTMTGEAAIAFSSANMSPGPKRSLNAAMKKVVPGWTSVDDPEMIPLWAGLSGGKRKAGLGVIDKFRDAGASSVSQARTAVSDPRQLGARDWQLMNVGEIDAAGKPFDSGHRTYNTAIPGQGVGRLKEDVTVFDMIADQLRKKGPEYTGGPDKFSEPFLRNNPMGGVITEDLLRNLGY